MSKIKEYINMIIEQQKKYSYNTDGLYIHDKSQFFTPEKIAKKMVLELELENYKLEKISILEPAAGFGVLIVSLIEEIIKNEEIKIIDLVCFELDEYISRKLDKNLLVLKKLLDENYRVDLNYTIINYNFILYYEDHWLYSTETNKFDIVISNPPYKKINKSSQESQIMRDIVFGQPNLYQLFIAMSISLLNKDGVYVSITPRNYLSGKYSMLLRKYIIDNYHISSIHSFDNMNIFSEVDQEVIITKINTIIDRNDEIIISNNGDFKLITKLDNIMIPYDNALIVPKDILDMKIYSSFKKLPNILEDLNIRVSVGPVVQFRNKEFLSREVYKKNYAPLLISGDIGDENKLKYYRRVSSNKITHNKSIDISSRYVIENSNYLVLRKVASKKDNKLIILSTLEESYFEHKYLGIDNNILYFSKINGKLDITEMNGLYCYLNSMSFEKYYSVINGTYTININDFNYIKFPRLEILKDMGKEIKKTNDYSKENCEYIFRKFIKFQY